MHGCNCHQQLIDALFYSSLCFMNWLTVSLRNMVASDEEAYFKVLDTK